MANPEIDNYVQNSALDFQGLVSRELVMARTMNPRGMNSFHEGFAVLLEEVDEFKEEVWKKRALRNKDRLLGELVQIAAMAQRIAEDLDLLPTGKTRLFNNGKGYFIGRFTRPGERPEALNTDGSWSKACAAYFPTIPEAMLFANSQGVKVDG